MKSLMNWGGLVLVLLIALFAFGCGGRGDNITSPPPPGGGGFGVWGKRLNSSMPSWDC